MVPGLKQFLISLKKELIAENIVVETSTDGKKVLMLKDKFKGADEKSFLKSDSEIDQISDLLEISKILYRDLLNRQDDNLPPGNEIIRYFIDRKALVIENFGTKRLDDILDKGRRLLQSDPKIAEDASQLLNIKARYFSYLTSLLQYFIMTKLVELYPTYEISRLEGPNDIGCDIQAKPNNNSEPELLFQIKFRRKIVNTLNDDLIIAFENHQNYQNRSKKEAYLVLVIFTDEGSDEIDRADHHFVEFIESKYPSSEGKIIMIPIFYKNASIVRLELRKLKVKTSLYNYEIQNFSLISQTPTNQYESDTHRHPKFYYLKEGSYQITFRPSVGIPHWKAGVVLARNIDTLATSKFATYFYLEKLQKESKVIFAFIDDNIKQIIDTDLMLDYSDQRITLRIYDENNSTRIQLLNEFEEVLSKQIDVGLFPYFQVLAWADKTNDFSIDVRVAEKKLTLQKPEFNYTGRITKDKIEIIVQDKSGLPISDSHVVLLSDNSTFHEGRTNEFGNCIFRKINKSRPYKLLIAHHSWLSAQLDDFDISKNMIATLAQKAGCGSLIFTEGQGEIPGLNGSINPVKDNLERTYMHTRNISVNDNPTPPVNFKPGEPIILEDNIGVTRTIIVRLIQGNVSLLDLI